MNGQQGGDPAKLGRALVQIVALDEPPLRWIAGADAVAAVEQKAHELLAQADAHRELSVLPRPRRRLNPATPPDSPLHERHHP